MELLIVRHAPAEDRTRFALSGKNDELRPLTPAGQQKMHQTAKGLATWVDTLDILASSPLRRAVQTASIIQQHCRVKTRLTIPVLAPECPHPDFLLWLQAQTPPTRMAIVGHEPDLGMLIGWLLTGSSQTIGPLKKGGAYLLNFPSSIEPGKGQLLWALTPAQLRRFR